MTKLLRYLFVRVCGWRRARYPENTELIRFVLLRGRARRLSLSVAAVLATLWLVAPSVALAGLAPAANRIQSENALPGTSGWERKAAPSSSIAGYALATSVAPGDELRLAVSTAPGSSYRVEVYRLGWYGGIGARLEACRPSCAGSEPGISQPLTVPDWSLGGEVDERWRVADTVPVPASWTSGYYLAELVLTSGASAGEAALVPFVVRAPAGVWSAILVQAPAATWQAYNDFGGASFYTGPGRRKASRVSFERPYATSWSQSPLFYEYPLVRFLERSGYDVSYTTDLDVDRDPGQLLGHRLVIVAGHSEYWTAAVRGALENARDAGVNLAFLGGNDGYREIALADGGSTILKGEFFRDLSPPRPECGLLGVQWQGGWVGDGIEPGSRPGGPWLAARSYSVNPDQLNDPWFRGTGLDASSTLPGIVGYEWDGIEADCVPGAAVLFHYEGVPWARPPAWGRGFASTNADAVRYLARSGATVFSAGSIEFSWGLDDYARRFGGDAVAADPRLQRFMLNALDQLTRPPRNPGLRGEAYRLPPQGTATPA